MTGKRVLVTGQVYHIFNKSIANYKIFTNNSDYVRIRNSFQFYKIDKVPFKLSKFLNREGMEENSFGKYFSAVVGNKDKLVQIIAYCVMQTHIHLILKQLKDDGITIFMGNLLNSYARYFNLKYKRKGPLWESRFKDVLIETDEQLLHFTRYIHLNPVTAYLVENAEDWVMSSYKEYLSAIDSDDQICEYKDVLDIKPSQYKEFVEDRIDYQRELAKIKKLLID
ncbi:MAG: transposase [Candidatus Omnitrophota bacterium]